MQIASLTRGIRSAAQCAKSILRKRTRIVEHVPLLLERSERFVVHHVQKRPGIAVSGSLEDPGGRKARRTVRRSLDVVRVHQLHSIGHRPRERRVLAGRYDGNRRGRIVIEGIGSGCGRFGRTTRISAEEHLGFFPNQGDHSPERGRFFGGIGGVELDAEDVLALDDSELSPLAHRNQHGGREPRNGGRADGDFRIGKVHARQFLPVEVENGACVDHGGETKAENVRRRLDSEPNRVELRHAIGFGEAPRLRFRPGIHQTVGCVPRRRRRRVF